MGSVVKKTEGKGVIPDSNASNTSNSAPSMGSSNYGAAQLAMLQHTAGKSKPVTSDFKNKTECVTIFML